MNFLRQGYVYVKLSHYNVIHTDIQDATENIITPFRGSLKTRKHARLPELPRPWLCYMPTLRQ